MQDKRALSCIANMLKHVSGQPCSLLVATDRVETITKINHMFAGHTLSGCQVQYILTTNKTGQDANGLATEHGPFISVEDVVSDLYMLSKSDTFLGTFGSSFSILGAYLMADSSARAANIYRLDTCAPWAPVVGTPGEMNHVSIEAHLPVHEMPSTSPNRRRRSEAWPTCDDDQFECWHEKDLRWADIDGRS